MTLLQDVCPFNQYKYCPIEKDGVMGSCECYDTRQPINRNDFINLTWEAVEEKYDKKVLRSFKMFINTVSLFPC